LLSINPFESPNEENEEVTPPQTKLQEIESSPEEDFSDWETINSSDYQDLPPPNVITDPFK
jgi:hypothetical protein